MNRIKPKTLYLTFKTFLKQLIILDETFDILFLLRNIIPDDNLPGYGLQLYVVEVYGKCLYDFYIFIYNIFVCAIKTT